MGCDIHVYTEFKPWYGKHKGEWFSADHFILNPSFGDNAFEKKLNFVPIYDDRNYSLFSILAGVRNYGDNEPILEPRGVPDDCCPEIKAESDSWGEDGHSRSYFTLKELLDYQKKQPKTKYSGYVTLEGSKQIDRGEAPDLYWQGGGDPNDRIWRDWELPDNNLQPFIDALIEREKEVFWIFSDKPEDIEEHAEEIRVVFWFDN